MNEIAIVVLVITFLVFGALSVFVVFDFVSGSNVMSDNLRTLVLAVFSVVLWALLLMQGHK
jgi:hypothetical protein